MLTDIFLLPRHNLRRYALHKLYVHGFTLYQYQLSVVSSDYLTHIRQGWLTGTGEIIRLTRCQVTLKNTGKIYHNQTSTRHSTAQSTTVHSVEDHCDTDHFTMTS